MRSSLLATAGVALACLPCLLTLLVAVGIGTGALSAIGTALSEPGFALAAGLLAVALLASAAAVILRRRTPATCDTDFTATAGDSGRGRHGLARSRRGETHT